MTVRVSDIIVPTRFAPYVQTLTEQKSRLIQSGTIAASDFLNNFLAGGGDTITVPSFEDIDDEGNQLDDVVGDDTDNQGTYQSIGTFPQVAVRLNRNQQWKSMDLAATLAGSDPADAIAQQVAAYWSRKLQRIFVSTWNGIIADNAAAPAGNDTHTQDDLTIDISGGSYTAGVTDFSAEAFIDAQTLLGDSAEDLTTVMVHSSVYARMKKNNLIDYIVDSANGAAVQVPTFLGLEVIVDDGMPVTGSVYDTWLFGAGATLLGTGTPKVPAEVERLPNDGLGAGAEALHSRGMWSMHPVGHAWIGTAASVGGPTNAELAGAANWARRTPERKQVKMARLVTREA